jgi:hypothetical protein
MKFIFDFRRNTIDTNIILSHTYVCGISPVCNFSNMLQNRAEDSFTIRTETTRLFVQLKKSYMEIVLVYSCVVCLEWKKVNISRIVYGARNKNTYSEVLENTAVSGTRFVICEFSAKRFSIVRYEPV